MEASAAIPNPGDLNVRSNIVIGARFPDYELSDQSGQRQRLSEIQGHDPMILVLSRGHYCPKDRRQLRNLVELYPEIRVAYTKVVTISTDNLLETNEAWDLHQAHSRASVPGRGWLGAWAVSRVTANIRTGRQAQAWLMVTRSSCAGPNGLRPGGLAGSLRRAQRQGPPRRPAGGVP